MTDKEKLIDLFKTEGCIVNDESIIGLDKSFLGISLPNVMGEFYIICEQKDAMPSGWLMNVRKNYKILKINIIYNI